MTSLERGSAATETDMKMKKTKRLVANRKPTEQAIPNDTVIAETQLTQAQPVALDIYPY